MNLPNKLTMLRVLLIPVFMVCAANRWMLAAGIIFAAASLTDYFDGHPAAPHCLKVDVPGEFAAQARAAHLHKIALVDGVRRVDDGVDGARGFLTGVEVQRLISVDIDPQEPVRPFLFKAHIPQAHAELLEHRRDQRLHCPDGAAAFAFCHQKPPNKQERADLCGPLFHKFTIVH